MIILKRENVEIIVDSEAKAKTAESEGFIRIQAGESAEAGKPAETGDNGLEGMTKQELVAYAYEEGVDIDPKAKKADILVAVEAAME